MLLQYQCSIFGNLLQRFCIFYALLRRGGGRRQTLSFAAAFPCALVKRPHHADRGSGSWLPCAGFPPRLCGTFLGFPVQGELDFRLVYKPKRLRGCMESVYAAFQRLRSLPFRGGAAAAAEGVMIYRLPCRAALSVRRSLRAVSIAERNRYIENTPLGTPSGTALRLESTLYPVESLFPLSKGESHAGA